MAFRLRPPFPALQARFGKPAPVRPATNILVSTGFEIPGYRVARHIGVVRGVTARSRSAAGTAFGGGLQSIFGTRLSAYVKLAETARGQAFDLMCRQAEDGGANAVVGMRYDASEIMEGVTEVLAYGTAVWVEREA
jgi:uncharacterized protein YbjQ (UPF0145 family)